MAFIPLRDIGVGGIVTDQNPYDLELSQFPTGNNVAFHDGRIGKALGYTIEKYMGESVQPVHVQAFFSSANAVVFGTTTQLYRYDGVEQIGDDGITFTNPITNITRLDATTQPDAIVYENYSASQRWQSSQIGSGLIFNNGSEKPQYLADTSSNFIDLPNFPETTTNCIKPYKSFLIMAGYGNKPYTVRWSDEYAPTSYPSTWSTTDLTNLAGENTLSGNNGALIDQLTLGNTQIIYAERGVFAMDFIGAPLVFSFRELFADDGILNRGACAEFENKHLVVGNNDIYIHDGNQKQSVVDKRVRKTFFSEVANKNNVFCQAIPDRSEIYICYSNDDAIDAHSCNRALVFNWSQNAFTFVDLPNIRSLTTSGVLNPTVGWDNFTGQWNAMNKNWSSATQNADASELVVFGAASGNRLMLMNNSYSAEGAGNNSFLEATKIDLDTVLGKATNTIKQIKGIFPQIDGNGSVDISVGVSQSPQDAISWKTTKTYNIETDSKVDIRASGRYFAIRIESVNSTDNWRLTGLDIDIEEVASR